MLQTIHDSAVQNFQIAANLLIALQRRRLVLTGEAAALLDGRPKAMLTAGYNSLSPRFGICIPQDTRGEFSLTPDGDGLEVRNSGASWMTIEVLASSMDPCTCYLNADVTFPTPTVADVFLRDFTADGAIRDSLQTEWMLGHDQAAACQLNLPQADEDVAHRRIIIHLRRPPVGFTIRKLAMMLI